LIDYIKILLLNIDINRLLNIEYLDFKTEVSEKTGVLSTKRVAIYHFCKITIYDSGIVLFTGSIHKLWNSLNDVKAPNYNHTYNYKGFNGNQFTLNNILEVRYHLEQLFNCTSCQMIFQNIEFGVNTTPNIDPYLFLKGLLYHRNKMFEYRYERNFAQVIHNRFIFKIYNKSHQYGMSEFTLRIELKIIKIEELKKTGIKTFVDIDEDTLRKTSKMLLERFDEVMYYDYTVNKKALTKREKQFIKNYCNPRYWINDLKPNHRDRHLKRLTEITYKYSENLHQQIRLDIIKKCVRINQLSEKAKCVIINSSSIGLNMLQSQYIKTNKKCVVTGIPLTHEKEGSNYIKTSTINYLHENEKNTFIEVCSLLLNNTKGNRPKFESEIISHLAKQVRNRYYNKSRIKKIGYKKKVYKNQLQLTI